MAGECAQVTERGVTEPGLQADSPLISELRLAVAPGAAVLTFALAGIGVVRGTTPTVSPSMTRVNWSSSAVTVAVLRARDQPGVRHEVRVVERGTRPREGMRQFHLRGVLSDQMKEA
jgi:hypothetical protein